MKKNILFFDEISRHDVNSVGGKGANLGELYSHGFPVPPGFVVTAHAYFTFLEKTSLTQKIAHTLKDLDSNDTKALQQASKTIKTAILRAKMPAEIAHDIKEAYVSISGNIDAKVAVRSSATAEDLPEASFAGQQASFLDVKGQRNVVETVQKCWASLFEARAIFYRDEQGFSHFQVGIAVPVQKMVASDVSGIMFTVDPVTNNRNSLIIEAGYGLGQPLVSGELVPDQYVYDKTNDVILTRKVVAQPWELKNHKNKKVGVERGKKQKLDDRHIVALAKIGKAIEKHYKFPQDLEWALEKNTLYIVQTRPITTLAESTEDRTAFEMPHAPVLLEGLSASPGIAAGPVRILTSASKLDTVKEGDILVAEMTDPDYVPAMKRAAAIITDVGGRTSHASIVSRELGIACVVGTNDATSMLKNGDLVTVDGTHGKVFKGDVSKKVTFKKAVTPLDPSIRTATNLYVNLADPSLAHDVAREAVDGIGLLRAEFMVAQIGTHPRELIAQGKSRVFVDKLAEGISTFCQAFEPRPVTYRATDFKTNEYRSLKGGDKYEEEEPNPMLGYRGCYRYITDSHVFNLELDAIKKVREHYKNINLMIPFVHTVDELRQVKKLISARGLRRSSTFKLWMMVEIPSNVILLEDFIEEGIDGVSIGSNDLTMTILGVDRDNPNIASVYDERNEAVLWAFEQTIKKAKKHGITVSICGQAPSFFPDLTKKLVRWGITSISVNPDVINTTKRIIHQCERELTKG